MKKIFCLLYGFMIMMLLCACQCEHTWVNATCDKPVTCSQCGETAGDALGHKWQAGTCTTPKTCSVCQAVDSVAEGHKWQAATCTTPRICSVCQEAEGTPLGHTWQAATCTAPETCAVCHVTEGAALGHVWQEATCTTPKTCFVCHVIESAPTGHVWQAATCIAPRTCSVCQETEGAIGGHVWQEATCTMPKTCSVCGKTDGNALGHTTGGEKCARCGETLKTAAELIYEKCAPAVAYITVYNGKNEKIGSGSGFFITADGHFVTCYHVIDGASSAKIQTNDEKTYNVVGVYDYSEENDWAVLKVDGNSFPHLAVGSPSTYSSGSDVYAIGSPLGLSDTISAGIISNLNRPYDGTTYIQTTASISKGSSGGALINKNGQAIGITAGSFVDGQSLNLAVPLTYIEGYKTAEAVSLASLVAPVQNNSEIYNYLCYIIGKHSNSSFSGRPSYEFSYGDSWNWEMFYDYENESVVMSNQYIHSSGTVYYSHLWIPGDGSEYWVGYSSYTSIYASKSSASGSGLMNPKDFDPDGTISFDSYEGSDRYTDGRLAAISLSMLLDVLDYVLGTRFSSGYSSADLGFSI